MPRDSVPRWKVIHCKTCGKVIRKFDRTLYNWHVPMDVIMASVRRHYQKHHPRKFRESIRKGVETRKKNARA